MEAELEGLRREREEKLKAIAEKRRQVEELKKKREARAEAQARRAQGDRKASSDLGKKVDNLVLEILGADSAADGKSGEGPLRELASEGGAAGIGARRRPVALHAEVGQATVTVMPSEADTYDRTVQTDPELMEVATRSSPGGKFQGAFKLAAERARQKTVKPPETSTIGQRGGTTRKVALTDADAPGEKKEAAVEKKEIQEMTSEERERVLALPDFHAFFERTTLMVERVLGQESWDSFVDYKQAQSGDHGVEEELMRHVEDFCEDRWSIGRPVTDCRFSPKSHEMFLASYGQRENASLADPDGCMLVWNLAMKHRPEMIFSSQSAVLTARFHTFNPALFFGGTYSGGIVLWDARAKASPVQRTPLSGKGHSHPVQAMEQVGTQNATNLITASNDGRLCVWSLAMLALPQETIDLKNETKSRKDLAVMTLAFPETETNKLYVGAEDGAVCQCHIHGQKVGVTEIYDGHEGPVTGLDMHPRGEVEKHGVEAVGDLAVTASFDWSVKLWSVKQSQWPILSIDNFEDYVYDVRWHPTHPAIFCAVDGEGHVDLWDLNRSIETVSVRCEHPHRKLALNHCHWSIDGKKLVTGDSEGMLSVYSVDKSVSQPKNECFTLFEERVRQLHPIMPRSRPDSMFGFGAGGRGHLDARH
mmetsp:Transcript_39312/g.108434  ORF Transcript_39312/g.108434 Transcript_39312/m.108434 type:complete len:649 (-) Transcript_39312:234-2180(-)